VRVAIDRLGVANRREELWLDNTRNAERRNGSARDDRAAREGGESAPDPKMARSDRGCCRGKRKGKRAYCQEKHGSSKRTESRSAFEAVFACISIARMAGANCSPSTVKAREVGGAGCA
jgi:hypothetical protein